MTGLVERLRYGKDVESWWALGAEAASTIEALSERIAVLEARQHGGEHGAAGDAIDFACDHITSGSFEALMFIERWREGLADEWPEYTHWLKVQRAGAAEASASLTQEPQ